MHLLLHTSSKHKGLFDCFTSVNKKLPFAAFLQNSSQNRKNVQEFLHFYQFCLIFIRKDEVFHGLLFDYTFDEKSNSKTEHVKLFLIIEQTLGPPSLS